jgi:hypothetical protein
MIEKHASIIEHILYQKNSELYSHTNNDSDEAMQNHLRSSLVPIFYKMIRKQYQMNQEKTNKILVLRRALKIRSRSIEERYCTESIMEIFDRIMFAIAKIRKCRLSLPPLSNDVTCKEETDYSNITDNIRILPLEARNMFFNTSLISAFDYAPIESFSRLDWITMLEEAEKTIGDYEKWLSAHHDHGVMLKSRFFSRIKM